MPYERFTEPTLAHLLVARAAGHPEKRAYSYLANGETVTESWTYATLLSQASAVADSLRECGAAGERVLLLHENPLHFIAGLFGCAFAGAVAVPAYSPVGRKQIARIGRIVDDSAHNARSCPPRS
ncbi:AMP-binding protein [Nocardia sp. CNY236]|uniref:AMP-binding protein n=1 Tax=Nocardia sp. CNY236 TaxID=1169152 RepID=UPI000426133A|nr:AMP-binding protein [Nocardia sp. CNY236]